MLSGDTTFSAGQRKWMAGLLCWMNESEIWFYHSWTHEFQGFGVRNISADIVPTLSVRGGEYGADGKSNDVSAVREVD